MNLTNYRLDIRQQKAAEDILNQIRIRLEASNEPKVKILTRDLNPKLHEQAQNVKEFVMAFLTEKHLNPVYDKGSDGDFPVEMSHACFFTHTLTLDNSSAVERLEQIRVTSEEQLAQQQRALVDRLNTRF